MSIQAVSVHQVPRHFGVGLVSHFPTCSPSSNFICGAPSLGGKKQHGWISSPGLTIQLVDPASAQTPGKIFTRRLHSFLHHQRRCIGCGSTEVRSLAEQALPLLLSLSLSLSVFPVFPIQRRFAVPSNLRRLATRIWSVLWPLSVQSKLRRLLWILVGICLGSVVGKSPIRHQTFFSSFSLPNSNGVPADGSSHHIMTAARPLVRCRRSALLRCLPRPPTCCWPKTWFNM